MRHYRLLHPRNYLSAADLDGKDFTLTILSISHEELTMEGGKKDVQPVITFDKAKKKFVLNRTNAKTIAGQYGPDVDQWVGKPITLYPTTTKAKGEITDCIRIRPGKAFSRGEIAEG
jgi:hypothetical protein